MEFILTLNFSIIAVFSAFFAALANIFAKILLKDVKGFNVMGLSFLMVGSTLLIFSPIFYKFNPSWASIGLLYTIGILDAAANYYYFKSFEQSEASVATSLLALAPIITFIGAFMFLGTTTSPINFILAVLIMGGIIILSGNKVSGIKDVKNIRSHSLFAPLMASILFGLSSIPSKALLSNLSAINAPTLYMFRATIIGMISFIFMRPNLQELGLKHYKLIWLQGLLAIITWTSLYYALSKGNPGITMTLANTTPAFTIVLGALFLREKITIKKIVSVLLILCFSVLIMFSAKS
jgi:drug/metabolite transporter (DMT)-like permease